MYGRIINGVLEIMPSSGYLKTGKSVIGYDTLMLANDELRKSEGWLNIIYGDKPVTAEDEYLKESYVVDGDNIIVTYTVEKIPS